MKLVDAVPRIRLDQDWLNDREARRKEVWNEITMPSMGHGALEALREQRVQREMERRLTMWLHNKGLDADFTVPQRIMKRKAV